MQDDKKLVPTTRSENREDTIRQILMMTLFGSDDGGKRYSIKAACEELGVPRATWYYWEKQGHVDAVRKDMVKDVKNIAQDIVLPHISTIIQNIVDIAAYGKSPNGGKVGTGQIIAAYRELKPLVGLDRPIEDSDGLNAAQFLQQFVPKPLNININADTFLYKGDSVPKMGNLPSVEKDDEDVIDGEVSEE